MTAGLQLSSLFALKAAAVFGVVMGIAVPFLRTYHPFARFGPANQVTTARALIVALVAGLIGEPNGAMNGIFAAAASVVVTALDGIDGWLARRTRMASAFGARFDMEIDALLILVLAILAWQYEKAGAWIVLAGLLRYLFVAAGWAFQWMQRPLPPSRRRQAVCVLQIIGSSFVVLPAVTPPLSTWIAAGLLLALSSSFLVDVIWLWNRRRSEVRRPSRPEGASAFAKASADRSASLAEPFGVGGKSDPTTDTTTARPSVAGSGFSRIVTLAASLVLLDASLTFHNIWPTPAIGWSGELSIELAVSVLAFVVIHRLFGPPSRAVRRGLAVCGLLLVIGRYVDVTAPALWGRTVNFYWDLQFVPDVAAMLARAAPLWLATLTVTTSVVLLVLMYALIGRALDQLWNAMDHPSQRRGLTFVASIVVMLFGVQLFAGAPRVPVFSTPVTMAYARQAGFLVTALSGSQSLPPSPSFDADLSRVKGADVLLFFLESYGAVVYERPEFASRLAPARAEFEASIRASGHDVVSAFVESPTFGGSSWFAHLTLLSGLEVRNPETNALLMTEHRETLPSAFARHGYRTIAIMPGLWYPWPEGAFYGFTDIYTAERLNYRGPPFGWWTLSDQFALARLDERELRKPSRAPLFVFFPTVSTHTPFAPAPPYQPDWPRMLTDRPYSPEELDRAYSEVPDWLNLAPSYVTAVSYAYEMLGGYLKEHAGEDFVMILIGDHQPPALVSGEGAPWDVPVHVITNRRDVLSKLISRGFQTGVWPKRPSLGKMHTLTPSLLDAFSSGS